MPLHFGINNMLSDDWNDCAGFALQGYLVVYDTEESSVGWMESDCDEDEFLRLQKSTRKSSNKKSRNKVVLETRY